MKEHKEINVQVAELVMGWSVVEEKVDGSIHRTYVTLSGAVKTDNDIPDFANRIELAWGVVEQMLGNGFRLELSTGSLDANYAQNKVRFVCELGERETGDGESFTAPLAICLAAIDTVRRNEVIDV